MGRQDEESEALLLFSLLPTLLCAARFSSQIPHSCINMKINSIWILLFTVALLLIGKRAFRLIVIGNRSDFFLISTHGNDQNQSIPNCFLNRPFSYTKNDIGSLLDKQ